MIRVLLSVMVFLFFNVIANGQDIDLEKDFLRLDSVVANRNTYIKNKINSLTNYQKNRIQFVDDMDRCNYYKRMFDEYMKFDSDSALHYAKLNREVAEKNGFIDLETMSQIDIIYVTLLKGDYLTARSMLSQLKPIEEYPSAIKPKVAVLHMEFGMRITLVASNIANTKLSSTINPEVWNTYGKYLPESGWMYAYYKSLLTNEGNKEEIQRHIDKAVFPSIQAAMLYFALGKIYSTEGNDKMFLHCLIMSAINDIMTANREASSMVYIVHSPFLDKSSKRAAEYAMACTENTKAYGDKGRSLDVVMANATITKAYEDKLQSKERTMTVAIGLLAISLVFIAFMLYLLIKKSHRLTIINDKLRDMGESLQKKIISEETIREELKESNMLLENELKYRNKSFIDVYRLASRYITDVENYKKSVFNLITAGKIDKARKELSSVSATEKYLQEFYAQFDKAFISSHPDFINRFNSLLKPECRIVPTPSTLTPELRIYALVSIGITDSVTIADFLHYSPQTIYNYRLRIRHNACIPEKNFAETVAKMYDDVNKSKIGGGKI